MRRVLGENAVKDGCFGLLWLPPLLTEATRQASPTEIERKSEGSVYFKRASNYPVVDKVKAEPPLSSPLPPTVG